MKVDGDFPVIRLAFAALMAAAGCGGGDDGVVAGCADPGGCPCDPMVERCVLARDIDTLTIEAGVEQEDLCQSWTLDNETELWVNAVGQANGGGYHHANWFFVPDDELDLPDGSWSCSEQGFDELGAAVLGGYLFALSTQSLEETQSLPEGSAIRIPPYSRVIGSNHLLNGGAELQSTLRIELHTLPPHEVEAKMAPARIEYRDLTIDPMARSSFTVDCPIADSYDNVFGEPLQYELHYLLGHYHELGSFLQLEVIGGDLDGEVLMRHDGYGENFGVALDPPVELGGTGATGLRFTCGFDNPRDDVVGWGIGDQEMCVIALQARTNLAFDADAQKGKGELVGTDGDGLIRYGSPCTIAAFEWDFDKEGGPAR